MSTTSNRSIEQVRNLVFTVLVLFGSLLCVGGVGQMIITKTGGNYLIQTGLIFLGLTFIVLLLLPVSFLNKNKPTLLGVVIGKLIYFGGLLLLSGYLMWTMKNVAGTSLLAIGGTLLAISLIVGTILFFVKRQYQSALKFPLIHGALVLITITILG